MKKLFLIGAFLFSVFAMQNAYSQCGAQGCGGSSYGPGYGYGQGYAPSAQAPCCEQATGQCYCMYVRYEPSYYTTKRCVEEQIPCSKRCCRYVPKYYQIQRCRYVPEYYSETICRQEPEYYDVQEFKCCKRTICEPQCQYIPRYYWKYTCNPGCP